MSSLLLTLPAELRSAIYGLTLANSKIAVTVRKDGSIFVTKGTPLLAACHPIWHEALAQLHRQAPTLASMLTFHVQDFDFEHVIAYLRSAGDKQLRAMGVKRNLRIQHTVSSSVLTPPSSHTRTEEFRAAAAKASLTHWLDFAGRCLYTTGHAASAHVFVAEEVSGGSSAAVAARIGVWEASFETTVFCPRRKIDSGRSYRAFQAGGLARSEWVCIADMWRQSVA